MGARALSPLLLGLMLLSATAAAEPRPALGGVSAVRIANYGAPSVLIEKRDEVRPILEELNRLRQKSWRRGEAKVPCYSTLMLMAGKKLLVEFRITRERFVERPGGRGRSVHNLEVSETDFPTIGRRLKEILPAKDCN